jgi:hypothetical protein
MPSIYEEAVPSEDSFDQMASDDEDPRLGAILGLIEELQAPQDDDSSSLSSDDTVQVWPMDDMIVMVEQLTEMLDTHKAEIAMLKKENINLQLEHDTDMFEFALLKLEHDMHMVETRFARF